VANGWRPPLFTTNKGDFVEKENFLIICLVKKGKRRVSVRACGNTFRGRKKSCQEKKRKGFDDNGVLDQSRKGTLMERKKGGEGRKKKTSTSA